MGKKKQPPNQSTIIVLCQRKSYFLHFQPKFNLCDFHDEVIWTEVELVFITKLLGFSGFLHSVSNSTNVPLSRFKKKKKRSYLSNLAQVYSSPPAEVSQLPCCPLESPVLPFCLWGEFYLHESCPHISTPSTKQRMATTHKPLIASSSAIPLCTPCPTVALSFSKPVALPFPCNFHQAALHVQAPPSYFWEPTSIDTSCTPFPSLSKHS